MGYGGAPARGRCLLVLLKVPHAGWSAGKGMDADPYADAVFVTDTSLFFCVG